MNVRAHPVPEQQTTLNALIRVQARRAKGYATIRDALGHDLETPYPSTIEVVDMATTRIYLRTVDR